jgi:hypothetical protein
MCTNMNGSCYFMEPQVFGHVQTHKEVDRLQGNRNKLD